jgi:hypothetical protein
MAPWVRWGKNKENCFYMCLYRENTLKIFFSTTTGPCRKAEIYMEVFRHSTKANLLKSCPPGIG